MGESQTFSVSYVASHAARLLQESVFVPNNPNIQVATFFENGLKSDYGSLQTQFRRRLSRGMTALASYTWSHCLDYGSENFNLGYQRGNCDFDVRHNFSAAFSYDLPTVGRHGVAHALNHWGLDDRFTARRPFPITMAGKVLTQPEGRLFDGGLSFVTGQPVYLSRQQLRKCFLQGLGDLSPGSRVPRGTSNQSQCLYSRRFRSWQYSSQLCKALWYMADGFGCSPGFPALR